MLKNDKNNFFYFNYSDILADTINKGRVNPTRRGAFEATPEQK